MKGFERKNQLLSLCGLNCGLCPMRLEGHCGGCGRGNQSCGIARCSLTQGKIEYCYACAHYPCERYQNMADYEFFIVHRNQKADLEKAQRIGIDAYNREQEEKVRILELLLSTCNDGRRKNFFCVAVNLLELSDIREALRQMESESGLSSWTLGERCAYIVSAFQEIADRYHIILKLNKKK